MMNLNQWAIKHGVPFAAVEDLRLILGTVDTDPSPQLGESEAAIQTRVRLEASRKGGRLWRNNVGVLKDINGTPVRYGLCNESKQMNTKIKSSDLIGINPIRITPAHVGQLIGQFVSIEVKAGAWHYDDTPRERAQLKWLKLIMSLGGKAAFANREGTL